MGFTNKNEFGGQESIKIQIAGVFIVPMYPFGKMRRVIPPY